MDIIKLCRSKGIKREYSNARTPQQNGVAERKNKTLIETMLADSFLPNTFWAEAVSTACYVLNRVLVTKPQNKTPYELLTENKANHTACPKETNISASKQDDFNARNSNMEDKHAQEYYVLPLWSFYTTTVKRSKAKNRDEKLNDNTDSKKMRNYFSHLIRYCDFHEKRMAKQIEFTKQKGQNNPHQTLKGIDIVDSGCFRYKIGNKAYLVDYQDFHGGPVAFRGSKGQITGKENKANHTAGPKETNISAGKQDDFNARNSNMEDKHAQEYYVLPLWSFYTTTIKRSKAKNRDKKLNDNTDSKKMRN
nr:putative ribonuclease H-like domain-containing protein [Tanacetum cinerariifolium]